jgi:hypothetical protein
VCKRKGIGLHTECVLRNLMVCLQYPSLSVIIWIRKINFYSYFLPLGSDLNSIKNLSFHGNMP